MSTEAQKTQEELEAERAAARATETTAEGVKPSPALENLRAAFDADDEKADPEPKPETVAQGGKDTPDAPAASATGTETEQDPVDELPESNPSPDHWRTMREQYKALKAKVAAQPAPVDKPVETAAAPPPAERVTVPPAPEKPPTAQPHYEPEFLFETMAKAAAGEVSKDIGKQAEEAIIAGLSPAQVQQMLRAAKDGAFGDRSPEVVEIAREMLPMVVAQQDVKREQQAAWERHSQARNDAWAKVATALPELKNTASPIHAAFKTAAADLEREIPGLWAIPHAPLIVQEYLDMMQAKTQVTTAKAEADALKKENAELKKRLGVVTRPLPSGNPGAGTAASAAKGTPESRLAAALGVA